MVNTVHGLSVPTIRENRPTWQFSSGKDVKLADCRPDIVRIPEPLLWSPDLEKILSLMVNSRLQVCAGSFWQKLELFVPKFK